MTKNFSSLCSLSNDEALYHLLKKEHDYYKDILTLTHYEHEKLISKHPPQEMHSLLSKKKALVACIRDIEKTLTPLKKYWINKSSHDPSSLQINELLTSLCDILKEILQLDLVNQKLLKNLLSQLPQVEMDDKKI
ncbi:flagellar export chaperone FlgN [Neochlamydia sp. S13]|uniref:flagellar export chaperone FlgN n=1 Tax=Neochlamydia sp. S13 TaxID=1353976 RepID=UPI0005AB1863|nr:flagellar export chaperone FlgN [Neochlamydia sp. S13]BBI16220.1 hypothetical protein NCS13_1_0025 [Neochlamydia sp. S13]